MKNFRIIVVLSSLVIAISGCTGSDDRGYQDEQGGRDGQDAATQGVGSDGAYPGVESSGDGTGYPGGAFDDPRNPLSKSTVYFLYDSADLKPEYESVVEAHAQYLASHASARVTLEGHADERGSREYNIALGEQRANVVARKIGLHGVSNDQIRTVSYGEEKPVARGQNETAWQLNRRVQIVYSRY